MVNNPIPALDLSPALTLALTIVLPIVFVLLLLLAISCCCRCRCCRPFAQCCFFCDCRACCCREVPSETVQRSVPAGFEPDFEKEITFLDPKFARAPQSKVEVHFVVYFCFCMCCLIVLLIPVVCCSCCRWFFFDRFRCVCVSFSFAFVQAQTTADVPPLDQADGISNKVILVPPALPKI